MESAIRIVLTGGPCAGKSSGLAIVKQKLEDLGYIVILMDEMATNVLRSGVHPVVAGNMAFQKLLVRLQLDRDTAYIPIIDSEVFVKNKKVILLYDRGILDGKAYCSTDEFRVILAYCGVQENSLRDSYHGVFHLVTAADGAAEFYTKENNTVRIETAEEAIVKDKITLDCWVGHPHLRVINNKGRNFDQKMTKLLGEIMGLLGEPVPLEKERKFLISMPNILEMQNSMKLGKSEIIQTYLHSHQSPVGNVERRVRQRGNNGDYSYYYTEKVNTGEKGTRTETEKIISKEEYVEFLMEADTNKHQIRKDRYCFVHNDRYFELDIYPFWDNKAILEIEVDNMDEKIELPPFIEILKEVTDVHTYSNYELASNHYI